MKSLLILVAVCGFVPHAFSQSSNNAPPPNSVEIFDYRLGFHVGAVQTRALIQLSQLGEGA